MIPWQAKREEGKSNHIAAELDKYLKAQSHNKTDIK